MVLKDKKLFLRCLDKVEQQPCGVTWVLLGGRIRSFGKRQTLTAAALSVAPPTAVYGIRDKHGLSANLMHVKPVVHKPAARQLPTS